MKLLLISVLFAAQLSDILCAGKAKVVCYWPNWHMDGPNKHTPENIDPTLCTHIHHAFHVLDATHNVVKDSAGPQPDVYKRLVALKQKNPDIKIIISVGGAGAPDAQYSKLINNSTLRAAFIKNTIAYLKQYKFDGLDLDWEYPVCWNGDCTKGPKSDKANFGIFVKELRTEFDKQTPKLSLSAAVVGGGEIADEAYDYKSLGDNLDYMSLMTYDDTDDSTHKTEHHSRYTYCTETCQFFASKGISKDKLLMGIPFYGHAYKLTNVSNHKIGAPVSGEAKMPDGDEATYRQMCDLIKNKNWVKETPDMGHDPIAYHDTTWVGFDDPYAAYDKSKWVADNGYGGAIVWEITQDDYLKKCCSVTYPMLRAISHGLYGTGSGPETYGCEHK